ncbi:MAG: Burkholderia virus BcepC6B [Pseudomonadota bacterium]|jgi:hypothetical protein
MASQVSIMNRALTHLGESTILLPTDNVKQARVLSAIYDDTRDAELRANRWKFAIKRTRMSALAEAPAWGYSFQYELPDNYLAMVQVNDIYVTTGTKQKAPWSVEGRRVLTDLGAPLALRYVARIVDTTLFDALFTDSFSLRLAMNACEALTQSDTKFQKLAQLYKEAISRAVRVDAVENPPDELPSGSWITSREGGSVSGLAADGGIWPSGVEVL